VMGATIIYCCSCWLRNCGLKLNQCAGPMRCGGYPPTKKWRHANQWYN
jgi:hypothetical protein